MISQYDQLAANRYPGGKNLAGVYQRLINTFPTHWFYAEPFVGSGAIYRRKPPAIESVLIDCDPRVCRHWQKLVRKGIAPGATIKNGDGIRWLEHHAPRLDSDWLIYCDPPYPRESRAKDRVYNCELTAADHGRLLYVIRNLLCPVVISSYHSPMYANALDAWHHEQYQVVTRWGGQKTEHLWCNFDPAKSASPTSPYVGRNYRERERVKRKLARHVQNFRRLPAWERHALLAALISANSHQSP